MILHLIDATLRQTILEKLVDKVSLGLRHQVTSLMHGQAVRHLFLLLQLRFIFIVHII